MLVYHNAGFSQMSMDHGGVDQPTQTKDKSSKKRGDWWEACELQLDSLAYFASFGSLQFELPKDIGLVEKLTPPPSEHSECASELLSLAEPRDEDCICISTRMRLLRHDIRSWSYGACMRLHSSRPSSQALQQRNLLRWDGY